MKKYVYKIMLLISNFTGDGLDTTPLKSSEGVEYEFSTRKGAEEIMRLCYPNYPNKLYVAKIKKEVNEKMSTEKEFKELMELTDLAKKKDKEIYALGDLYFFECSTHKKLPKIGYTYEQMKKKLEEVD